MPSNRSRLLRQFFAGLGLGSIALVILWGISVIGQLMEVHQQYSGIPILIAGLALGGTAFLIQVVLGIDLLTKSERRFVGYGMLAMSLVSVIVTQQGCLLIFQIGRG